MCTRGINGDPSAPGPTPMSTAADLLSVSSVTEPKVPWLWSQQLFCGPYQSTPPYPGRLMSCLILSFHLFLSLSEVSYLQSSYPDCTRLSPVRLSSQSTQSYVVLFSINVITSLPFPLPHSRMSAPWPECFSSWHSSSFQQYITWSSVRICVLWAVPY